MSNGISPMHFGMSRNLSTDDLHEYLLGLMPTDDHHEEARNDVHGEHHDAAGKSTSNVASSGNVVVVSQKPSGESDRMLASVARNPSPGIFEHSGSSSSATVENSFQVSGEDRAQVRSERKRTREKQRRNDVNRQFADLTEVLKRIETEESTKHLKPTTTNGDNSSNAGSAVVHLPKQPPFANPSNRVDLIARSIAHLERLQYVNKQQQEQIASLEQQLEAAKKAGEETAQKLKEAIFHNDGPAAGKQVMMMVPMMFPSGGVPGHPSPFGTTIPMGVSPFMASQPVMASQHYQQQQPQQNPPATASVSTSVGQVSQDAVASALASTHSGQTNNADPGKQPPSVQQHQSAMQVVMQMPHMMMTTGQQPHPPQQQQLIQFQPSTIPAMFHGGVDPTSMAQHHPSHAITSHGAGVSMANGNGHNNNHPTPTGGSGPSLEDSTDSSSSASGNESRGSTSSNLAHAA